MFFNTFWVWEGAIFVLCWLLFRFVFCIDFWSLFGAISVSFWGAFGRLLGAQIDHFWHRFWHEIPNVRLHVRVGCARPCGCVLGAPKSGPRGTKSGPRAAKSGPRAAQERPRAAQERPRAAKSDQKAAKSG